MAKARSAAPARAGRRRFLGRCAAAGVAAALHPLASRAAAATRGGAPQVVVVGGGFAGARCARALRSFDPRIAVTLLVAGPVYTACPFSNEVIAGLRELSAQQFGYERLAAEGITVRAATARAVDPAARTLALHDGGTLRYDRLVLAPGIALRWDALPGYDRAAASRMPHAWQAGDQTLLLRRQLEAMPDGGTVVIAVPDNPIRCPPAPYERASLIAHYLQSKKPRSKLIVLDAKDSFSRQSRFEQAWQGLYPGRIEWVPFSKGGRLASVEPAGMILATDFDRHHADVANVIPPQKAGLIAERAGVTDRSGWCPVDPLSFESTRQPGIHVIGDAAIAGALPKSGYAGAESAKVCAAAVVALLAGRQPVAAEIASACYSLIAPDYALPILGRYRPANGLYAEVAGSTEHDGRPASQASAPEQARRDAVLAADWFRNITHDVFG